MFHFGGKICVGWVGRQQMKKAIGVVILWSRNWGMEEGHDFG
jgi:hypothetical protein